MTFELRGARLVVAMNILTDLNKYKVSDYGLDIEAIKKDFEAYFYGLEKYLSLLLQNFGSDVEIAEPEPEGVPETVERPTMHLSHLTSQAAEAVKSPVSGTVPLLVHQLDDALEKSTGGGESSTAHSMTQRLDHSDLLPEDPDDDDEEERP
jgi:hypothetical protein